MGFILLSGVADPTGGTKALWPIFGIANQLLASIALCLATTVVLKTQIARKQTPALALVTLIPLAWLLSVTVTASVQKIGNENPAIGFLAAARVLDAKLPALHDAPLVAANRQQHANAQVDAAITATFLALVATIVLISLREWWLLLRGSKPARLSETDPVWQSAIDPPSTSPAPALGVIALSLAMLKEVSGESALDRAQLTATAPHECPAARTSRARRNVYLSATEDRFKNTPRCC